LNLSTLVIILRAQQKGAPHSQEESESILFKQHIHGGVASFGK